MTKNEGVRRDLTAYGGGPNGLLYGGVVQEVAIPSGRVLFEWNSLDHVAIEESHAQPNKNHFDYFHINSIDVDADGHLLVSARKHVDRVQGAPPYRQGAVAARRTQERLRDGAGNGDGVAARRALARRRPLISIFDNGAAPQVQTQSRVILVRLDLQRMRATLERAYKHHPNRLVAKFMGSGQVLPDGGVVAGWGSEPFVTEFAPNGSIRFEALMPKGGQNYRAFRFPWKGTPTVPPRLKAGVGKQGRGDVRELERGHGGRLLGAPVRADCRRDPRRPRRPPDGVRDVPRPTRERALGAGGRARRQGEGARSLEAAAALA